ncbi:putative ATP-dependent helicase YeeB [Staphylococcus aureus]|uniref:Putative ATP-dependent helicase YeeB n=1 Tax=Staphylococcus aureus TaxID=1280 RepID=A0A5S9I2J9_STAAU|nr:DEAD/DEAH box helicase [Staphylococcus aureus]BBK63596.1 putative ATP-dependent helicase YeeB [Staphylococcus aureus]BBK66171.1 putative ATP-dependent helicase YeeB [Staphylococcus aureus]HDB8103385.1 DEAD/DEAH box helicase family protein [Staphylococcus aureus]
MSGNLFKINFDKNFAKSTNSLGMREMQARVYEKRNSKYLLVKAPPASGKSRALMFVGLDKLKNQGLKKIIITVPERSIGKSFRNTELKKYGFYWDWNVKPQNNLTIGVGETSKVKRFVEFMNSNEKEDNILISTHATLRYAFEELDDSIFDNSLLAIDEFHHVSRDDSSVLGNALRSIMSNSSAHILAMTGSYFRGDSVQILEPNDEDKFEKVTYTYYEQLNGYQYLKSFAMGYSFYRGQYTEALDEVIDVSKKSIIHIPNVNSSESTKEKYDEVDRIMDVISDGGDVHQNSDGIYEVNRPDGKQLLVADLVNEESRDKVTSYLANITDDIEDLDKLDIIIALGMAKEGFDWPFAEYALTIGYRNSLTEIIQIIGRVTRDSANKSHAQFTNLIAQPDAQDDEVLYAVNNLMKAITASLLMEQVLAPVYNFKPKDKKLDNFDEISIKGLNPSDKTERTEKIIKDDMADLKSSILQSKDIQNAIVSGSDAEMINKTLVPRVIIERYPDLTDEELETVRQHTVANVNFSASSKVISNDGNREIIKMSDKFINIDELNIDLVDSINPFQRAYEMISRDINAPTLQFIQDYMSSKKYEFTDQQLVNAYQRAKQFRIENGRNPERNSKDEGERYLAFALLRLAEMKREREVGKNNDELLR